MKKTLFIAAALISSMSITAQEKGHYLSVGGNIGSASLKYDLNGAKINNDIGYGAKIGYSFFFNRNWGIGSGVGINFYNTEAKYNNNQVFFENLIDDLGDPYKKEVFLENWTEKQNSYFFEIPLLIQFQHKFNNQYFGIYLNAGVKAIIPVKSNYEIENGSLETKGHYDLYGGVVFERIGHGFDLNQNFRPKDKNNLKIGFAATANAGFTYGITRCIDIYAGAFLDYGFTDIHKDKQHNTTVYLDNNHNPVYNGMINNQKVIPVNFGAELGLKFKLGASNLESRLEKKERINAEKLAERNAEILAQQQAEDARELRKIQQISVKQDPNNNKELNDNLKRIGDLLEKAMTIQGAKAEKVIGNNNLEAVKIEFESDLMFKTGKSELSQKSKEALVKLVQMLQENPQASVDIFGHTDNVGSIDYNQRLSVNRAQAVSDYLKSMGVKNSQIHKTVGKNFAEPIADNNTIEGKAKNRRVDVIIYSQR